VSTRRWTLHRDSTVSAGGRHIGRVWWDRQWKTYQWEHVDGRESNHVYRHTKRFAAYALFAADLRARMVADQLAASEQEEQT